MQALTLARQELCPELSLQPSFSYLVFLFELVGTPNGYKGKGLNLRHLPLQMKGWEVNAVIEQNS